MCLMSGLDSGQIRHAILTAQAKGYKQVRIRAGEDRFSAVLSAAPSLEVEDEADPEQSEAAPARAPDLTVPSPAVGFFRALEPPIQAGDKVLEGDKVGEVVALGLANDVAAKEGGEVTEVCVSDGESVEFGQRILVLKR